MWKLMVPQTAPVTRQQNEGTGLRLSADTRPSAAATGADLEEATAAAALIEERGFNRGQSLSEDLAAITSQAQKK
jgi:hypothetical protein